MLKLSLKFTLLTAAVAILALSVGTASAEGYHSTGILESKNILSGEEAESIDAFGYHVSDLPAGTTVEVQFSQNGVEWYDAGGVLDGWETLSEGNFLSRGSAIDLSTLAWPSSHFFYRLRLTTTESGASPTVQGVELHFTPGSPTKYHLEGRFLSQDLGSKNLLLFEEAESFDGFGYRVSDLPTGATIKVQFSQNGIDWYNAQGDLGVWEELNEGEFLSGSVAIDLSELGWFGRFFFYRLHLETTDPSVSGVLDGIRVHYTAGDGTRYHSTGTLTSKGLLDEETEISAFRYSAHDITASSTLKVRFSQDGDSWYNSANEIGGWDELTTTGPAELDLSGLDWTTNQFYYQFQFDSKPPYTATPALSGVVLLVSGDGRIYIYDGARFRPGVKFQN